MQLRALVMSAAALLAGCQTAPSLETTRAEVERATLAWVSAVDECDVAKITALYDPEAVLWATTSPVIFSTPAEIRQYFERTCSANLQLKVILGPQLVRAFGDTAINSGSYTVAFVAQGRPGSIPARYTFAYRKVADKWLIVDHHSSTVPAAPPPASAPQR